MQTAIVGLLIVCCQGCSQQREREYSASPDRQCSVSITDVYANAFTSDPVLKIILECNGRGRAIYAGSDDWRYRKSLITWSAEQKSVRVVACSHISRPVQLIGYLDPLSLALVNGGATDSSGSGRMEKARRGEKIPEGIGRDPMSPCGVS